MKFFTTTLVGCFLLTQMNAQKLSDSAHAAILDEVVVSASKVPEKILQSPVSIEKEGAEYFKNSAAPSFFDALENVKGVQIITPSIGFKVINTRGFANTTNVRFAQLVDGMDIQAPHIGAPIANAIGPNDMDVESVEVIPGVASALYGMNTINGLANIITKDPFTSQGICIQQKTGINHVSDSNSSAKIFSETSLRIAHAFNSKFALKVNGTFTTGTDWIADDHTDINTAGNATLGLTGLDNPAYDGVNGYGNESSNRKAITLKGKNYVIARTGYYEKQIADYSLQNIKGDAGLFYKINDRTEISYAYKFSLMDNIYQRSNRFRLENYLVQQHGLNLRSKSITVHAYWNVENTGDSYNLRSMAENTDKAYKSDDMWFGDFTTRFNSTYTSPASVIQALQAARIFADTARLQPGSAAYQTTFNKLKNINNWDSGAALRVKANLINIDAQINLTENILSAFKKKTNVELLAGFDYRTYVVIPDGNYFINPTATNKFDNLVYSKSGGFISATRRVLKNKVKLGTIIRADRNDYFSILWNPRFTAVYSPNLKNNFRIAYQSGNRFPSLFEGFSNVNSGGVKRVGGLKVMSNGVFENSYLKSSIDFFKAAVTKDVNTLAITKDSSIKRNASLLKKNGYTYLKPEHVSSIELGYKGLFVHSRLFVDVDFYYNKYNSFIAQVEASVAKTSKPDSVAFYLNDNKTQDRYRLWTNSKTTVYNYGGSLGLKYNLPKNYILRANVSYAKLDRKSGNDGLEDGFNTPQWITNISVANENIYKGIGAGITYKWQNSYYSQTFLVTGTVPAYGNLDVQASYHIKAPQINIKLGGTNVLNKYYYSFLGGPSIGGFYYMTLTYTLNHM